VLWSGQVEIGHDAKQCLQNVRTVINEVSDPKFGTVHGFLRALETEPKVRTVDSRSFAPRVHSVSDLGRLSDSILHQDKQCNPADIMYCTLRSRIGFEESKMLLPALSRSLSPCITHSLMIIAALALSACGGGGDENSDGGNRAPSNYAVGGAVSGLSGTVTLQNNSGETISVSSNGSFRFTTPVAVGQSYQVRVASHPINQQCAVTAGSGVIGSADINDVSVSCTTSTFAVRGSVSGLNGTVVLRNNGGDDLTLSANGSFRFTNPLAVGQNYQVTVLSQPANQQCAVTADSGVMGSSDVTNVAVNCAIPTFTVRGTLSGLNGTVVLRNSGGEDLTLSANGEFSFPTPLPGGAAYTVTVLTHPANQRCSVAPGSGVTGMAVTCVPAHHLSGTITGLAGTLVLQNNAADDLSIASDGSFTFAAPLVAGATYQVSVRSQPSRRKCAVTSGSGVMGSSDVTNVAVTCVPTFTVGGAITGVVGSIVLQNGSDQLTVNNSGSFTFGTQVLSGASYAVSVLVGSAPTHRCLVTSGTGTVAAADITNVQIQCVSKAARYKPESYSSFISANGTGNVEGTWILLAEGTLSRSLLVAGTNPREDYQLWSRAIVRVRRDPLNPTQYFTLTCGPGGARNYITTSTATTFGVPFYSSSTSTWSGYGVTIVDAITMERDSVSQPHALTSVPDLAMGWNLSWVLKRISDDPFANPSTLRNNLSSQSKDAACIYESEGTHAATQHDGITEISRVEGFFFWADGYESHATQLLDDINSYFPGFAIKHESGHRAIFRAANGTYYWSSDGDQISTARDVSDGGSSYSVQAAKAGAPMTADETLDIEP
jgi:hypothetical protein